MVLSIKTNILTVKLVEIIININDKINLLQPRHILYGEVKLVSLYLNIAITAISTSTCGYVAHAQGIDYSTQV